MLIVFENIDDMDFRQLMDVYEEGNRIYGEENYTQYTENLRFIYSEQDFYNYLLLFFKDPAARYAVWVHENCYVSALRLERYTDGLLISALETAPSRRYEGFATNLIKSTVEYLKAKGSGRVYSHVDKQNFPSVAVHKNCGFGIISHQAEYLDGTITDGSYTLCLEY